MRNTCLLQFNRQFSVVSLLCAFTVTVLAAIISYTPRAEARSPERIEPPPCVKGGNETFCLRGDPSLLSVSTSGDFVAGGTITVTLVPKVPVCADYTEIDCYSGASAASSIGSCVYTRDGTASGGGSGSCSAFSTTPLAYTESQRLYVGVLDTGRHIQTTSCELREFSNVYIYGGDARDPNHRWTGRAPDALVCQVTLVGDRPDKLLGPTWIKVGGSIRIRKTTRPTSEFVYAETLVWLDGDLINTGPEASFFYQQQINEPGGFNFTNTSTHSRDVAMTYTWDFGDGKTSTAKNPAHQYTRAGDYTVILTAKDVEGLEDSVSHRVSVEGPVLVAELLFPDPDGYGQGAPPISQYSIGEEFDVTLKISASSKGLGFLADVTSQGAPLRIPASLEVVSAPTVTQGFTLSGGSVVSYVWRVRAVAAGNIELSSSWSAQDEAGRPVRVASTTINGRVSGLGIEIIVDPKELVLNLNETENRMIVTARVSNKSQHPIEDIVVAGGSDGLTITSNDPNEPGVPVDVLSYEPAAPESSQLLAPGASIDFKWTIEAYDAPADLSLKVLANANNFGKTITGLGTGELKIVDDVLLTWGMKAQRTAYISGQLARIDGVLINETSEEDNPKDLLVLVYNTYEGNVGRGYVQRAGDPRPTRFKLFELGPGEQVPIQALPKSQQAAIETHGKLSYGVRLWVLNDEGKAESADAQAVLADEGEFTEDEFEFTFSKNPASDQNPLLDCGYNSYWCAIVFGSSAGGDALLESIFGVAKFMGDTALDAGNYSKRFIYWKVEVMKNAVKAVKGDRVALNRIAQEIAIDLRAYFDSGIITLNQGADLTTAVADALSNAMVETLDTIVRGDGDEITFMLTRIGVENIDMVFEALVAAKGLTRILRQIPDTNSAVGKALVRQEARQAEELTERLAKAKREGTPLTKAFAAGDKLSWAMLRDIYGVSKQQIKDLSLIAKAENVIITFRSRSPISLGLLKKKLAWPKPQSIKFKTVNKIDALYLGYRKRSLGIVELVEPPKSLKGLKEGSPELNTALDQFMDGLKRKHPDLTTDKVLAAEVRKRMEVRTLEWDKYIPGLDKAVINGLPVNFEPGVQWVNSKWVNGAGRDVGVDELRKVTKRKLTETTPDGRSVYEIRMSGPDGAELRSITGDVDFLAILNRDGTFILDNAKRIRVYRRLAALLDMQHGESFSFFLKKVRDENLECCLEGIGDAMVSVAEDGIPRAAYFVDNRSILKGGPNSKHRLENPSGDFVLLAGAKFALKSKNPILSTIALRTFEETVQSTLRRAIFFLPSFVARKLIGLPDTNTPAVFSREPQVPVLQLTETGGFQVWTPEAGWQPISASQAIELGGADVADMAPMTSLPIGASKGDIVLEITSQNQLGATGPFFEPGDTVVINPGGSNEEFSVVEFISSLGLSAPLLFDHRPGEAVYLVPAAAKIVDIDATSGNYITASNLTNSGVVSARDNATGDPISVLGNYIGVNGTLVLDVGASADTLLIGGNSSGTTVISINDVGLPNVAGTRILLVSVTGTSAGQFVLIAPIVVGNVIYTLEKQGNNWYLVSAVNSGTAIPTVNVWNLMILSLLLVVTAGAVQRRRAVAFQ